LRLDEQRLWWIRLLARAENGGFQQLPGSDSPAAAGSGPEGGDGDSGPDGDAFGDADLPPAATDGPEMLAGPISTGTDHDRKTPPGLCGSEDENMGKGGRDGGLEEDKEKERDDEYGDDDCGRGVVGSQRQYE